MPKTAYQKRLEAGAQADYLSVLDEIAGRLKKITAYPPILPYVGEAIADVVQETRSVVAGSNDSNPA